MDILYGWWSFWTLFSLQYLSDNIVLILERSSVRKTSSQDINHIFSILLHPLPAKRPHIAFQLLPGDLWAAFILLSLSDPLFPFLGLPAWYHTWQDKQRNRTDGGNRCHCSLQVKGHGYTHDPTTPMFPSIPPPHILIQIHHQERKLVTLHPQAYTPIFQLTARSTPWWSFESMLRI